MTVTSALDSPTAAGMCILRLREHRNSFANYTKKNGMVLGSFRTGTAESELRNSPFLPPIQVSISRSERVVNV